MAIIWPYKEGKSVEQELEFYEELLTRVLAEVCLRYLHRAMPETLDNAREILQDRCYQALEEIRGILADDHLDDADCFARIEEIVQVYEKLGGSAAGRHDFG